MVTFRRVFSSFYVLVGLAVVNSLPTTPIVPPYSYTEPNAPCPDSPPNVNASIGVPSPSPPPTVFAVSQSAPSLDPLPDVNASIDLPSSSHPTVSVVSQAAPTLDLSSGNHALSHTSNTIPSPTAPVVLLGVPVPELSPGVNVSNGVPSSSSPSNNAPSPTSNTIPSPTAPVVSLSVPVPEPSPSVNASNGVPFPFSSPTASIVSQSAPTLDPSPGNPPSSTGNTIPPPTASIIPQSAPVPEPLPNLNASNGVPPSPHFVIYADKFVPGQDGPPPVADIAGFNVFALSFLLTSGAADKAQEWAQLSAAQRSSIKASYSAAGIKVIVSLFGSTDAPTSSGADPISTANTMAAWVKQFDLDGVDVDYEDFNAINKGDGKAEAWLISFTQQLRVQLPQEKFILTHAPVAPWFSPGRFKGGAYVAVHAAVGDLIDWYNVQFYNQGADEYTTCSSLLTASSTGSALFQIEKGANVPLNKLVIGKPGIPSDASNGFINPTTLAGCLEQAKNQGWSTGVSVWEFPDVAAPWIKTVRSQAFPI